MKIKDERKDHKVEYQFRDVGMGETFEWRNQVYIKCQDLADDEVALNTTRNVIEEFAADIVVVPVPTTLVIEGE